MIADGSITRDKFLNVIGNCIYMTNLPQLSSELGGILAGLLACVVFLIFHQFTISNIWFSAPFMLVISALAGYLLVHSYATLYGVYTFKSWTLYIMYFVLGLAILGLLSVLVFTPKYDSAYILNLGGAPPSELITGALPLTFMWILLSSTFLVYLKSADFTTFALVLGTSASLYLTLGLNVSILGKVEVAPQHQYLVEKFLLMNVMLGLSFLAIYSILHQLFVETKLD